MGSSTHPHKKTFKPMPKIENNDLSDLHYEDYLFCIESANLVLASEICGMHTLTSLIKKVLSRKKNVNIVMPHASESFALLK